MNIQQDLKLSQRIRKLYNRMRQTLYKIADSDLGLKERLKILWREQCLTITAMLTAVGMTISTIILAIKNTFGFKGNSGSKKPPSNDPDTVRQWVKNKLQALARLLGKLGAKTLSSFPAMIGSIVSWVLGMLKKTVEFTAQHVYMFITFIATIIGYYLFEQIHGKKKR